MKAILSLLISGVLVVSGFGQTRNVLVGTNNAVVQPTNFWSADATNARSGLGLGSAATNAASAFQPSSGVLSNLSSSNAVNLTNLRATNLVGVIPSSNIPSTTLTNISGTLPIASGGTGATNASNARVNLGATTVGDAVFIATNAAAARTAIGALATNGDATNLTNLTAANITGTVALASNVTGTVAITNGGTGATNAATARTNLGATTIGNALFTATNSTVGRAALDLSSSNDLTLDQIDANVFFVSDGVSNGISFETDVVASNTRSNLGIGAGATNVVGFGKIVISEPFTIEEMVNNVPMITFPDDSDPITINPTYWNNTNVRSGIGLGWSALTNTNAGTGLVSVNTNGEVVSPTNFWQVAPINTRVQYSQPVVTATNAATNARNLYLYSLAISTTGVTNTITLPTNAATFFGDVATIIHEGPTNSFTAIRQIGSATNITSLNQFQEAVQFIYNGDGWKLADNISQVEPLYFSGTNATANAAASRTNIGLGETNTVTFSNITASGTLTATSTVTAKTNLIVQGYLDFTTNATNSNPATNNHIQDFIEIRVGTNQFWLPLYK
jgi:hypothetical protein